MRLSLLFLLLALTGLLTNAHAQSISFNNSLLIGAQLTHPTTLSFGPDNRLYVATQAGEIYAYTIRKNGANNYEVTNTEAIMLVKNIPNHDDRAGLVPNVTDRQITGILVAGTAANPILYVNSSDPRIGGGGELGDQDLDTNSGTLSRLTKSNGTWTMVHTVRGLPRSEENHHPNGMALDPVTNILYIAEGGNTNAGSPSNNFGFLTEYALAGAVLSVDLNMINTVFGGAYTLPTLDDPTRPNMPDGSDVNDPWGGNDGLNQAKLVLGGPVQIYSPGYRNIYDVTITRSAGRAGRMYTIDNGANGGWGGYPVNEGTPNVTNDRIFSEPGSTTNTATDAKVNNLDNLHFITGKGYYGGHPNPIRANPAGAGLYWFDNATNQGHFELNPTVDWPPVPVSMANPVESDFRNPGVNDGAIWVTPHSTNGLVEYSASNFNGAMRGNLLAASSMSNEIMRIELNAAGDQVTRVTPLFTGFGEFPLDVLAQGDADIYPGTVWTVTYNPGKVVIFEPTGSAINCSGDNNNFNRDDDSDGYSNGDETLNGTDPCSPASKPEDFDGDLVSNLRDADDDNDGLSDIVDKFAVDASNGLNTTLPLDYPFLNGVPNTGLFGVGVTGLMTNGVDNYAAQFDRNDQLLIVGGAVGAFSVPASAGDATTNNQKYAFQFGVPIASSVGAFTMHSRLLGAPFFDGATGGNLGTQFHGIYFGTGDQDNYFKFGLHGNNGNPGFQILVEQNGAVVNQQIIPVANILNGSQVDLFINVNVVTGVVQCQYQTTTGSATNVGQSFTVSGSLLSLLQAHTNAVAIGIIASSGNKPTFSATWDFMRITTTGTGQFQWQPVTYANGTSPTARHENAFVEVGGKFYLLGGRGIKNVGIYDPATKIWTAGAQSPIELHHFQAIAYQNKIYAIGALTGAYPSETPVANVYIYDVATNAWTMGATIPAARRRGSSGVVQFNNKFYIIAGTQNGHNGGFVNWVDSYDPATNAWATLANAPEARDHFQASVVNGKIYCIGGRRTTQPDFAGNTVSAVNVYDIATNTWTSPTQIPTPRAGHAVMLVNNDIVVAGGEVNNQAGALNTVESYNVTNNTWTTRPTLNVGRHATQLIYFGGALYLAAGSSTQAAAGENNTMAFAEYPSTNTPPTVAQAYPNQTVPSTQTSLAIPVNTIFADNGGVGNLTFTVANNSNSALVNSTQVNNGTLTLGLTGTTGTGTITLRATDTGNLFAETTFTLTVTGTTTPTLTNVIRINAGGSAQNFGGEAWVADQYFTGGTVYSVANAIDNTTQDALYQTERFGNFQYRIPVTTAGTYAVDLHFAEVYWTTTGSRVFNVNVENGQFVRNNLDLVQTYGAPFQAIVIRADNINVTDGFIDISFVTVADNAKVSGIAVGRYSTANTPPTVAQPYANQTVPSTQASLAVPLNTIFADNGGVANLTFTVPNNTNTSLVSTTTITNGTLTLGLTGTTGTGTITLRATDAGSLFVETTFQLTVTAANAPPTVAQPYPNQTVPSTQTSLAIPVSSIFADNGGVANLTYTVTGNTNPGLVNSTQVNNGTLTLGLTGTTGAGIITLRATDTGNLFVETTFTLTVTGTTTPTLTNVIRINAGGPAQTFGSEAWAADQYFTGGTVYSVANAINNTTQDAIYQTERFGNFQYRIPVTTAGTYAVDLHFAEVYWTTTGSRVFNVNVENGQFVRNNLDLVQTYGAPYQAVVIRADNINVTDGFIDISFVTVADNAKVSGIAVGRYSTGNAAPTVAQPYANQTVSSTQTSLAVPLNTIFTDDGGVGNLTFSVSNNTNTSLVSGSVITNGTLTLNLSGTTGTGTITLRATDAGSLFAETAFQLTVTAANTPPTVAQSYPNQTVPSTQTNLAIPVNTIFADNGGVANLTYTVTGNTNSSLVNSMLVSNGTMTLGLSGTTGSGIITLRATDAGNLFVETTFTLTVTGTTTPTLTNVIRINAGGPAMSFGSEAWVADQYFTGGIVGATSTAIGNTTQDALYQTERFGNFQYRIPVTTAGTYAVDLHFTEIWWTSAGRRVFNVNVENGQFVRNNLDVFQAYGTFNAGVIRADNINVTDGFIDISFVTVADNATIAGIAVSRYSTGGAARMATANNAPVVVTPPNIVLAEGKSWTYQVIASDPFNESLTYAVRNLPASLYLNEKTGLISGTIEVNASVWPVTLSVTNESGITTERNFTVTIREQSSQENELGVSLYPNPAEKLLTVKVDSRPNESWSFTLTDVSGKSVELGSYVLKEGVQTIEFDLEKHNLRPGMYMLTTISNRGRTILKVALK